MPKILLLPLLLCTLAVPARATAAPVKDCPQFYPQLKAHGLPPKIFGPIMWRESRCNPASRSVKRYNGTYDLGALQINSSWRTVTMQTCRVKRAETLTALLGLNCNLKVAAVLYNNGKGLGNWRATSGK
jgi:hypothetical protein